MKISIITAGSRGDVQPYIALGVGLQAAGYTVRVLATDDFETLITGAKLAFSSLGDNVQEVLQGDEWRDVVESGNYIKIQQKMSAELKRRAHATAPIMLAGCADADLIIGGFGGLTGGFSIAEKLGIPIIHVHAFPLTPTREFPSPIIPALGLGGPLNRLSAIVTRQILWQSLRIGDVVTREHLGLPKASFWGPFSKLDQREVPLLYGFSRHVLPPPADWPDHHHVTGYWFLEAGNDWQAPDDLMTFLDAGDAPVYIGFGSMRNSDPAESARIALDALERSGQRGILSAGWGGLSASDLPDTVHLIGSTPHSWLFPRMAAVVHHGGAGTTAAGLRAGVPSIIVPFFGDQPFWGKRVVQLGVGTDPIPRKQLTAQQLAQAITQAVTDETMRQKAADLGQQINAEDGITNAVRLIEHHLAGVPA